jgi:hypothetical protein
LGSNGCDEGSGDDGELHVDILEELGIVVGCLGIVGNEKK